MFIDFNTMEESAKANFKGGEKEFNVKMFELGDRKIMKGRLVPGASIGMHKHEGNMEILYVLKGEATVDCDGKLISVKEGECHYCEDGHCHSTMNKSDSDLEFFAVVV